MGFTYFLSPGGGGSLRPLKSAVGVYCHRGSMSVGSSESPRPGPVLGWALASLELDLGGVCHRSGHLCPVSLSLSAMLASLPHTPHPSLLVPWPHSQHSDGPGTTVAPLHQPVMPLAPAQWIPETRKLMGPGLPSLSRLSVPGLLQATVGIPLGSAAHSSSANSAEVQKVASRAWEVVKFPKTGLGAAQQPGLHIIQRPGNSLA